MFSAVIPTNDPTGPTAEGVSKRKKLCNSQGLWLLHTTGFVVERWGASPSVLAFGVATNYDGIDTKISRTEGSSFVKPHPARGAASTLPLLVALSCPYGCQADAVGTSGLVGFLAALVGTGLLAGMFWTLAFVVPSVAIETPRSSTPNKRPNHWIWDTRCPA
jgi:hypothetical protein